MIMIPGTVNKSNKNARQVKITWTPVLFLIKFIVT